MQAASVLRVTLGERSYEITIDAGLLDRAGSLLAPLLTLRRVVVVTDENLARTSHPARSVAALERADIASRTIVLPAGESYQELGPARAAGGRSSGARRRAPLGAGGAGRRGDRRSRRLCRRRDPAWAGIHPDPDHAPGPGGQLGRRQDRHQHRPRQEPGRRLPSTAGGADRHRRARRSPAARAARGLRRGRQIRLHPRRRRAVRLARAARRRLAGRRSRSARGGDPPLARGQGRDRRRRRARDHRRACAAQFRPHLRPCLRGAGGLRRRAAARRGGGHRHGRRVRAVHPARILPACGPRPCARPPDADGPADTNRRRQQPAVRA